MTGNTGIALPLQPRVFLVAALLFALAEFLVLPTALREAATLWRIQKRWYNPFDCSQLRLPFDALAREATQQTSSIGMLALLEDRDHISLLDNAPGLHNGDIVTSFGNYAHVMGDK